MLRSIKENPGDEIHRFCRNFRVCLRVASSSGSGCVCAEFIWEAGSWVGNKKALLLLFENCGEWQKEGLGHLHLAERVHFRITLQRRSAVWQAENLCKELSRTDKTHG